MPRHPKTLPVCRERYAEFDIWHTTSQQETTRAMVIAHGALAADSLDIFDATCLMDFCGPDGQQLVSNPFSFARSWQDNLYPAGSRVVNHALTPLSNRALLQLLDGQADDTPAFGGPSTDLCFIVLTAPMDLKTLCETPQIQAFSHLLLHICRHSDAAAGYFVPSNLTVIHDSQCMVFGLQGNSAKTEPAGQPNAYADYVGDYLTQLSTSLESVSALSAQTQITKATVTNQLVVNRYKPELLKIADAFAKSQAAEVYDGALVPRLETLKATLDKQLTFPDSDTALDVPIAKTPPPPLPDFYDQRIAGAGSAVTATLDFWQNLSSAQQQYLTRRRGFSDKDVSVLDALQSQIEGRPADLSATEQQLYKVLNKADLAVALLDSADNTALRPASPKALVNGWADSLTGAQQLEKTKQSDFRLVTLGTEKDAVSTASSGLSGVLETNVSGVLIADNGRAQSTVEALNGNYRQTNRARAGYFADDVFTTAQLVRQHAADDTQIFGRGENRAEKGFVIKGRDTSSDVEFASLNGANADRSVAQINVLLSAKPAETEARLHGDLQRVNAEVAYREPGVENAYRVTLSDGNTLVFDGSVQRNLAEGVGLFAPTATDNVAPAFGFGSANESRLLAGNKPQVVSTDFADGGESGALAQLRITPEAISTANAIKLKGDAGFSSLGSALDVINQYLNLSDSVAGYRGGLAHPEALFGEKPAFKRAVTQAGVDLTDNTNLKTLSSALIAIADYETAREGLKGQAALNALTDNVRKVAEPVLVEAAVRGDPQNSRHLSVRPGESGANVRFSQVLADHVELQLNQLLEKRGVKSSKRQALIESFDTAKLAGDVETRLAQQLSQRIGRSGNSDANVSGIHSDLVANDASIYALHTFAEILGDENRGIASQQPTAKTYENILTAYFENLSEPRADAPRGVNLAPRGLPKLVEDTVETLVQGNGDLASFVDGVRAFKAAHPSLLQGNNGQFFEQAEQHLDVVLQSDSLNGVSYDIPAGLDAAASESAGRDFVQQAVTITSAQIPAAADDDAGTAIRYVDSNGDSFADFSTEARKAAAAGNPVDPKTPKIPFFDEASIPDGYNRYTLRGSGDVVYEPVDSSRQRFIVKKDLADNINAVFRDPTEVTPEQLAYSIQYQQVAFADAGPAQLGGYLADRRRSLATALETNPDNASLLAQQAQVNSKLSELQKAVDASGSNYEKRIFSDLLENTVDLRSNRTKVAKVDNWLSSKELFTDDQTIRTSLQDRFEQLDLPIQRASRSPDDVRELAGDVSRKLSRYDSELHRIDRNLTSNGAQADSANVDQKAAVEAARQQFVDVLVDVLETPTSRGGGQLSQRLAVAEVVQNRAASLKRDDVKVNELRQSLQDVTTHLADAAINELKVIAEQPDDIGRAAQLDSALFDQRIGPDATTPYKAFLSTLIDDPKTIKRLTGGILKEALSHVDNRGVPGSATEYERVFSELAGGVNRDQFGPIAADVPASVSRGRSDARSIAVNVSADAYPDAFAKAVNNALVSFAATGEDASPFLSALYTYLDTIPAGQPTNAGTKTSEPRVLTREQFVDALVGDTSDNHNTFHNVLSRELAGITKVDGKPLNIDPQLRQLWAGLVPSEPAANGAAGQSSEQVTIDSVESITTTKDGAGHRQIRYKNAAGDTLDIQPFDPAQPAAGRHALTFASGQTLLVSNDGKTAPISVTADAIASINWLNQPQGLATPETIQQSFDYVSALADNGQISAADFASKVAGALAELQERGEPSKTEFTALAEKTFGYLRETTHASDVATAFSQALTATLGDDALQPAVDRFAPQLSDDYHLALPALDANGPALRAQYNELADSLHENQLSVDQGVVDSSFSSLLTQASTAQDSPRAALDTAGRFILDHADTGTDVSVLVRGVAEFVSTRTDIPQADASWLAVIADARSVDGKSLSIADDARQSLKQHLSSVNDQTVEVDLPALNDATNTVPKLIGSQTPDGFQRIITTEGSLVLQPKNAATVGYRYTDAAAQAIGAFTSDGKSVSAQALSEGFDYYAGQVAAGAGIDAAGFADVVADRLSELGSLANPQAEKFNALLGKTLQYLDTHTEAQSAFDQAIASQYSPEGLSQRTQALAPQQLAHLQDVLPVLDPTQGDKRQAFNQFAKEVGIATVDASSPVTAARYQDVTTSLLTGVTDEAANATATALVNAVSDLTAAGVDASAPLKALDTLASNHPTAAILETTALLGQTTAIEGKPLQVADPSLLTALSAISDPNTQANTLKVVSDLTQIADVGAPAPVGESAPPGYRRLQLRDGSLVLQPQDGQSASYQFSADTLPVIEAINKPASSLTPELRSAAFDYYGSLSANGSGNLAPQAFVDFVARQTDYLLSAGDTTAYQSFVQKTEVYLSAPSAHEAIQATQLISRLERVYASHDNATEFIQHYGNQLVHDVNVEINGQLQRLTALQEKAVDNIALIAGDADLPKGTSTVLDYFSDQSRIDSLKASGSLTAESEQQLSAHLQLLKSLSALQEDETLQAQGWEQDLNGFGYKQPASSDSRDLQKRTETDGHLDFEAIDEETARSIGKSIVSKRHQLADFDAKALGAVLNQTQHLSDGQRADFGSVLNTSVNAEILSGTDTSVSVPAPSALTPDRLDAILDQTRTARQSDGVSQALEIARGNALADRFRETVGDLQKQYGLGSEPSASESGGDVSGTTSAQFDGAVPLLQTLQESPSGGFDIDFVSEDGEVKSVHTEDTVFKEVSDLIGQGVDEAVTAGESSASPGNRLFPNRAGGVSESGGIELPDAESLSSLNTAFAFQALFNFFERGALSGDTSSSALATVLKVHQFVNLARVGYGVTLDTAHGIKLLKQLYQTSGVASDTVEAGKSLTEAIGETLAGGADAVFGALSAGLDIYELTQAQTAREKAIIGTQLGFDAGSSLIGAGAIATGITGAVANSVEASATAAVAAATGVEAAEAAATAATAVAVGSAAAALGTAFSIGGSLFAGLGIGIVGLVDTFTKIASDVDNVGRYFYSIGRTYKTGGFVYDNNTRVARAVGTGAIDSINLDTGDITYADQLIDASGPNTFYPEDDYKAAPINIPKALGLGKTGTDYDLIFSKTVILPVGVPADRISYGYNIDPGITTNYYKHVKTGVIHGGFDYGITVTGPTRKDFFDDHTNPSDQAQLGFEVAREIGKGGQPFHFDIYNGSEWAIQHIDVKYKASHAVNVTLGANDRTLVVPTIPAEFVNKVYYNLYGRGGNYTLVLADNAGINAYQKGDKPATWVLSEQNLHNQNVSVTDHGIHIGSSYVGFQNPRQQTVLIPSQYDGDVFKVDFDSKHTIAFYVNGEDFDTKNHKPTGKARQGLIQHLKNLDAKHQLHAYTRITHYHNSDGKILDLAIYNRTNAHILAPVGAIGKDLLFLDNQEQNVIRLNAELTSTPETYGLPRFNGDSHLDGIGGDKLLVLQMTHTLPGGHKAHFVFTEGKNGFVLQRIDGDKALLTDLEKAGDNALSIIRDAFAAPVQVAGWLTVANGKDQTISIRSRDGFLFDPEQNGASLSALVAHNTEQTHSLDPVARGLHGVAYFENHDVTTIAQAEQLISTQKASADYDVDTLRFEEWGNKAKGTLGDFLGKNAKLNHGDANHWHDDVIHQLDGNIYLKKGDHALKLWHDQGIRLRLGGQDLYQNNNWDNWKYPQDLTFHAAKDGYYKLNILYYEKHGGAILDLKVDGKDLSKAMIDGPAENKDADTDAPAHLLALNHTTQTLATTDKSGKVTTVLLGKKGDIALSQKVVETHETSNGYRVTTDDGLTWLVNQGGQGNLVDVGKKWIDAHSTDWQQRLIALLHQEQAAKPLGGLNKFHTIEVHGLNVDTNPTETQRIIKWDRTKKRFQALGVDPSIIRGSFDYGHYASEDPKYFLKSLKAFYDPNSKTLVFGNAPGRSDHLTLIDSSSLPGQALLYDEQTKQLISQAIPTADQIEASFKGVSLVTNGKREDQTNFIQHGKALFEGHSVQLLHYVDHAYQITTGDGRDFRLLKTGPELVGVTDTWLKNNNNQLNDNYPTNALVAVYNTEVDGLKATLHQSESARAIAGWILPGSQQTLFKTNALPTQTHLSVLGYSSNYNEVYVTSFNNKDFTQDVYRLDQKGDADKFDSYSMAKIVGEGNDKTLLLSTAESAESLQVPAIDGVNNLVLATEAGSETFNINNDALSSYSHIIFDSGANADSTPDTINFQGILNANNMVATLDSDKLVLIDKASGHTIEVDHALGDDGKSAASHLVLHSLGLPDLNVDTLVKQLQSSKGTDSAGHPQLSLRNVYLKNIQAPNHDSSPSSQKTVRDGDEAGVSLNVDHLVQAMASMSSRGDVKIDDQDRLQDDNNLGKIIGDPNQHG
ncbi:Uncharacterised protein [BD1-7 clade bacterium]|uniref:TcdA/TcdB toxin pore forming domain-containing protein n=1 Tax=BD1-7 clade bacterium TaxID=2029982 RepID=A0A5S9PHZ5_9GAMM|nr:Uncharacterised protein [BD1-7 clade bacterium]CAA0103547.1 Uncharacterised protein [BD1-7 clade bacterium]